ncbi:MAG: diguanylate cyclase [Leptolyngbya sp. SIO3F4]|nr:diguanylate cyclase [Leptolyngbya sp. SIO3F4]
MVRFSKVFRAQGSEVSHFLYRQTLLLLIIVFAVGILLTQWSMRQLGRELIEMQALQNAQLSVRALNEARILYSEEAVQRIKDMPNVVVSHRYEQHIGGIPNPATYTIELAKRISEYDINGNKLTADGPEQDNCAHVETSTDGEMWVRMFSRYPFPARQKCGGGPQDKFEQAALDALETTPTEVYYRTQPFERFGNQLAFRYAEPIVMQASCVECHNKHPDSPRRNWKVGDVRGVLEVTQRIDRLMSLTHRGSRTMAVMLGGIGSLGLLSLSVVFNRVQVSQRVIDWQVSERTSELQKLADYDGLTKLANRRSFDEYLYSVWQDMQAEKLPISVLLGDVDYFKFYNDTYGHQAGDACLQAVAEIIQRCVQRSGDFAARYGGEEFVIVLPATNSEKALLVANTICAQLVAKQIPHQASKVSEFVTMSIGVATLIPTQDDRAEDIVAMADRTLYVAKDSGRNRAVSALK